MKCHKTLTAVLLMPCILFILLLPVPLTVSASDSQNDLMEQIEDALDISVFYQKETDRLIQCFDANESGCYAIGYRNNTIHVYDASGIFQYGYRFDSIGTYGIALRENSLIIYLGRSNVAVEIDLTGKCIGAEKVYFSNDLKRTHKQIGNANYYLERDIGIFDGDYSRLVRIDEQGEKIVLYDVTVKGYFAGVSHYVILSIFPIGGIICIAAKIKKEDQEYDKQSGETS